MDNYIQESIKTRRFIICIQKHTEMIVQLSVYGQYPTNMLIKQEFHLWDGTEYKYPFFRATLTILQIYASSEIVSHNNTAIQS